MLRYLFATFACSTALLIAAACGTDDGGSVFAPGGGDANGDSQQTSSGGFPDAGLVDGGNGDDDTGQTGILTAVIRDFRKWNGDAASTNPDFEDITNALDQAQGERSGVSEATMAYGPYQTLGGVDTFARFECDIVAPQLDDAGIPIYTAAACDAGAGKTYTTHGKQFFDEWYRDVPGRNVSTKVAINLVKNPTTGAYTYDSAIVGTPLADAAAATDDPAHKEFFPIDDGSDAATPFGNQGDYHNYSFTVELRTKFKYKGTETFTFSGDDDVFVYINKKLVINIGGIHEALTKTINVKDFEAAAGLTVGGTYTLDFFQAERHRTESNLRIETTLDLRPPTPILK